MIFEAHTDFLMKCCIDLREGKPNYFFDTHFNNLVKGQYCGGVSTLFTDVRYTDDPKEWFKLLWNELGDTAYILREIENSGKAVVAKNYSDIERALKEKKYCIVLALEGLSGTGASINQLETLYKFGFRVAGLTWNEKNALASGASCDGMDVGLTKAGEDLIRRMDELNMLIDVSHLNEKSFWDIVKITKNPIIASHSNSRALVDHRRNITDEQAKAIAKSGGVIGMNIDSSFFGPDDPTISRLADHVDHWKDVIGIDHICCGFDYCNYIIGEEAPQNIGAENVCDAPNILEELRKRNYTEEEIDKIAYKNLLRVIGEVIK